jgi:glycosyltransferase involved in cell wall biosynthesis
VNDFLNNHGPTPWEKFASELPCQKHLLDKARAVIVHSDLAKQMIKGMNSKLPIKRIFFPTNDIISECHDFKQECRKKLNIPMDCQVFASFGFATPAKLIENVIKALAKYKEKHSNFTYFIVGEIIGINIDDLLKHYELKSNVVVTGYTSLEDFKIYMGVCDIAFNLRYPTCGETSSSLHKLLGMGKPVIVTAIGSFSEYPDNVVIKVSHDENEIEGIYKVLCGLMANKDLYDEYSRNALQYASDFCNLEKNALNYYNFLKDLNDDNYHEDDPLDVLLDGIDEMDLFNDEMVNNILKSIL